MWERRSMFALAAKLIGICLDQGNFLQTAGTLRCPRHSWSVTGFVSDCKLLLIYKQGRLTKYQLFLQVTKQGDFAN